MTYRTLIVHVDATTEARERLAAAVALARRHSATLIGVGACGYPPPDPKESGQEILRKAAEEDLRQAEEIFLQGTADAPDTAWINRMQPPARALADLACGADLLVASRTAEVTIPERFARADELVLAAGAPVLLSPPAAAPLDARRIVVGWKNTRETRRAVWDSLPFLAAAETVRLVRVAPPDDPDDSVEAVRARLSRHGVKVSVERREATSAPAADSLVAAAAELGADLIVGGGYGQPRLREVILGGTTRALLSDCPCYLLLSH